MLRNRALTHSRATHGPCRVCRERVVLRPIPTNVAHITREEPAPAVARKIPAPRIARGERRRICRMQVQERLLDEIRRGVARSPTHRTIRERVALPHHTLDILDERDAERVPRGPLRLACFVAWMTRHIAGPAA